MKYLIFYDINSSYTRKKVKDILESYGYIRIQKSIFIGNNVSFEMRLSLELIVFNKNDSLIISPLCELDLKKAKYLGNIQDLSELSKDLDYYII